MCIKTACAKKKFGNKKGVSEMIIECPINDWQCPYFENGDCTMGKEAKVECDAWYGLEDE